MPSAGTDRARADTLRAEDSLFRRRTLLSAAVAVPAALAASSARTGTASAQTYPSTEYDLTSGFAPEGIALGPEPYAYLGSRVDGRILRLDLATGSGQDFSPGPGTPALGLKADDRRLFVAGGSGGDARVVDLCGGAVLAGYRFAGAPALINPPLINDVVLTPRAAWFTDSRNPFRYGLPLDRNGLPGQADVIRLPLSGDYVHVAGSNATGIARTPDGRALLIVQSATGLLFRVDPRTGVARTVDLGGERLTDGAGLLVDDEATLFVIQNRLNRIARFTLDRTGRSGRLVDRLTDPRFDVPAKAANLDYCLYLPNARSTTPATPTTPYNVVVVRL